MTEALDSNNKGLSEVLEKVTENKIAKIKFTVIETVNKDVQYYRHGIAQIIRYII